MNGNRFGFGSCKLYNMYCSRRILFDQNSQISLFETCRATLQFSSDDPTSYEKCFIYKSDKIIKKMRRIPVGFLIHEVEQYALAISY